MAASGEELAEERARQLDNRIILLCVIWIVLSLALIGYDSARDLLGAGARHPDGALPPLRLPALAPGTRAVAWLLALSFYVAAWRLVLREKPDGGRGMVTGFGVAYVVGMAILAFFKTFLS